MTANMLRTACMIAIAAIVLGHGTLTGVAQPTSEDPWPALARQIFNDRALLDGTGLIALEMPSRAEDAAVVPLTVRSRLPAGDQRRVRGLTIVIDENPSPLAAVFRFGPKAGVSAISTRVRVNSYTNVHVVAELSDGKLYMVRTYVKASGGCSTPAFKDASAAKKHVGEMRFRQFGPANATPAGKISEVQIMIRHPNNSGLQMDQVSHLYIPPFFIDDLKVWHGEDLIFAMEGGISIAENPSVRFSFVTHGPASFRAQAVDTDKNVYKGEWPAEGM